MSSESNFPESTFSEWWGVGGGGWAVGGGGWGVGGGGWGVGGGGGELYTEA
jgi:hypothetical protein